MIREGRQLYQKDLIQSLLLILMQLSGVSGADASGCCDAPLRQLVANAGEEGAIVVQEVKKAKQSFGYNVATGEYVDMIAAGIIDPAMSRYSHNPDYVKKLQVAASVVRH